MYAFWMRAERFYTFWMPLIIILLLFLAIVFVFAYSYMDPRKASRKYVTWGYLGLIALGAVYFFFGHLEYRYWIEQNDYISPGIRSFETILGDRDHRRPVDRPVIPAFRFLERQSAGA